MILEQHIASARTVAGIKWGWLEGAKTGRIHGFILSEKGWHTVGKCDGRPLLKEIERGNYCAHCVNAALKLGELQ